MNAGVLFSRRNILLTTAAAAAAAQDLPRPTPTDTGKVEGDKVDFPNWVAPTDRPSPGPPHPLPPGKRLGFAVVGLGRLSLEQILPAFGQTQKSKVVALVSGSPDKASKVAEQYGVKPESVYNYSDFDKIAGNPEIQMVYVVLPNGMHKEYVLRAAKAGKHVLCEKPMAISSAEAKQMIAGCKEAKRLLMIAYRSQYEPYNRALLRMLREEKYGPLRLMAATNVQNMAAPNQWRFKKDMAGGGSLPDIGLYCLNAARFLSGEEPVEVIGRIQTNRNDPRFKEVEETIAFTLRFPSGFIAECSASYGMHESRYLHAHTAAAAFHFENAFAYTGHQLRVSHRDGKMESVDDLRIGAKDQFALEMDHMADCVMNNRQPRTPGEEGLQDHLIMEAIYRSAAAKSPVALPVVTSRDTTRGPAPEEIS